MGSIWDAFPCFLHHILIKEPPRCLASRRGASQYAGVPNPIRVLNLRASCLEEVSAVISCLVMVCSCYSSIVIAGRGSRIPPRKGLFLLWGSIFGSFFVFFHTFYIILPIFVSNRNSKQFFTIFHRFSELQEGFLVFFVSVFSRIFRFVNENTKFSKSLRNTGHGDKNQGLRLEKSITNHKNLLKKKCNL